MAYTYKYPRPAVTADCVVITKDENPKVLLIQRGCEPFKECWAFPGGFMNMDETTEQCAIRELEEETGLKVGGLCQIGAYSKVDRDPRGRTITVAYLVVIDSIVEVKGQDPACRGSRLGDGAAGQPSSCASHLRRRTGSHLDFLKRVPLPTGGAFAYPLRRLLAAVGAYVCDLVLCHSPAKLRNPLLTTK